MFFSVKRSSFFSASKFKHVFPVYVEISVMLPVTGKIAWRREEALAYVLSVEMIDLPVSENQAKYEDEFGSHRGSPTFICVSLTRLWVVL